MTEARPILAIRIPRPWTSEEEFIAYESETISRTGILLLGTHSRPQGTILRFEVTLKTGAPLVRGEGRVVSYREDAFRGEPGLLLKFTRLDPRSKTFVDRVAALRQGPPSVSTASVNIASLSMSAALPVAAPPPPPTPHPADEIESTTISSTGDLGRPAQARAPTAPPPPVRRSIPPPLPPAARLSKRPSVPPPPPVPPTMQPPAPATVQVQAQAFVPPIPPDPPTTPSLPAPRSRSNAPPPIIAPREASYSRTRAIQAPPNREGLLARLRARAESLPAETRTKILAGRQPSQQ